MSIITYFVFTLFSIFIQFCIMDILVKNSNNNNTSNEDELFIKFDTPHALYYKKNDKNLTIESTFSPIYKNTTLSVNPFYDKQYFNEPTTVYDILIDENNTGTEYSITTEYMSTESTNETDVDIFPSHSETTTKPNIKPKRKKTKKYCFCDLLYQECDVNCCCDEDCDSEEQKIFQQCQFEQSLTNHGISPSCQNNEHSHFSEIDSLICNAHTNLPEKRNVISYLKENNLHLGSMKKMMFSWHNAAVTAKSPQLLEKPYLYGNPVWCLHKEASFVVELPALTVNNYCSGRKHIQFMKNEHYKCIVTLQDLEMFKINKYINESKVISVPSEDWSPSSMDCEHIHCTDWSVKICDNNICNDYNTSMHGPECIGQFCTKIALKVEYVFLCHGSNITNATIYLHVTNITIQNQYFTQEIIVKFNLIHMNSTLKNIKLSGNPGYINDMPIISSKEDGNYSDRFINGTMNDAIIKYPRNINGICVISDRIYNTINFDNNIRYKCKYIYKHSPAQNATENCEQLQKSIYILLEVNRTLVVSPFGNSLNLKDEHWIQMSTDATKIAPVFGEYKKTNILICNNLIVGASYVFTYADVSDDQSRIKYRIIDANVNLKSRQVLPIIIDDGIIVITVDISFLDITRPPIYEYAGVPKFNIHLPEDFFFPFMYSKCNKILYNWYYYLVLIALVIVLID